MLPSAPLFLALTALSLVGAPCQPGRNRLTTIVDATVIESLPDTQSQHRLRHP